ncbi:MAG: sugar transferase [Thermodesulfovibrionales bacterium]
MLKRAFDILSSFVGLVILFPVFIIIGILIKIDSKGPVFFLQERMGKDFRSFRILKFRTMVHEDNSGPLVTTRGDKRITRIGRYLRRYKLDELPQLLNVLKGDMSLVGPRPEVKKYVDLFESDYRKILTIRPGITDPASIRYSNEEAILSQSPNLEEIYIKKILPDKIKLSIEYVKNHNIIMDIMIILKTIFGIRNLGKSYEYQDNKNLSSN